jgi:creatinine amidohydrolase
MIPKRYWREMPSSAFGADAADWIAVLPLAATEQHGPHLPLGVDSMIAQGMIAACVDALPEEVPVTFLPVQEICKSNEHIDFPGTLTVDWDTITHTWIDIGTSVARAGPKTLIIVTSHGGNIAPIEIAARELHQRFGLRVVTTSWGRLGRWQEIYTYDGPIIDIHAGLSETSVMLALRPDLVDMDKAQDFDSAQRALKKTSKKLGYHDAPANLAWLAQDLNPQGAVGDASTATAEAGRKDIQSVAHGFCALIADLQKLDKETPE